MPDLPDIIEAAAQLVDGPTEVHNEYRRGVVELAAALCNPDDIVTVMGYAVCGVNRPREKGWRPCGKGPCCKPDGHSGRCGM